MQTDTIAYDTLESRPLPKWLIDQKAGVNTIQPEKIVMKEDNSLKISFIVTAIFILLTISVLTVYLHRKNKNRV
jgi:heme/copper-type cytochrome/quinol oxidase subunit 2